MVDSSYGYFIGLQVSYTRRILDRRQLNLYSIERTPFTRVPSILYHSLPSQFLEEIDVQLTLMTSIGHEHSKGNGCRAGDPSS